MSSVDAQAMPGLVQGLQETCHDMRQPVASVFALAAAALAEPGVPQAARSRLEQIVEQAEWLADLILHSLHNAGQGAPGICDADLLQVANETAAAECVTWSGELRIVGPAEQVFAAVHPVLLRRMMSNLLSNAIRAAGPAGIVTIEIGHKQGMVLILVEDTGPGFGNIPKGLGIGLAGVARNAMRHGGRLEHSNPPGGGTCVSLWLPIAPGPSQVADAGHTFHGQESIMLGVRTTPGSAVGGPTGAS
jgi:signal transduction histidine kinase